MSTLRSQLAEVKDSAALEDLGTRIELSYQTDHRLYLDPADAIDVVQSWTITTLISPDDHSLPRKPREHIADAGIYIVDITPGTSLRDLFTFVDDNIRNLIYTITDDDTGALNKDLATRIDPARPGLMVLDRNDVEPRWRETGIGLASAALALQQLSRGCSLAVADADPDTSTIEDFDQALAAACRALRKIGFTRYTELTYAMSVPHPELTHIADQLAHRSIEAIIRERIAG